MTGWPFLALILWGTIAGLDLASLVQGLLNRPLVAGAVAGAILGDAATGLRVGAVLELFALDVLPVGASRYPDYGAASVAAVALAVLRNGPFPLGVAVLLGLLLAQVGGWSLLAERRFLSRVLRRHAAALDAGVNGAARTIHAIGLASDFLRSAALAAGGLALVALLGRAPALDAGTARLLTLVAVAGGVVAVAGGAIRRAGTVPRLAWLAGGVALGTLLLVLR